MKRKRVILLMLIVVLALVLMGCKKGIPIEQSVESIYVNLISAEVREDRTVYTVEIENTSSKDIINLEVQMYLAYSSPASQDVTEVQMALQESVVSIFEASKGITLKSGQSLEYNFSYKEIVVEDDKFDHENIRIKATGYLGFESDVTGFTIDGSIDENHGI